MQTQTTRIDYRPRAQFWPFHQRRERFAALVCHRRAGKTVACINDLILRASICPYSDGRYAYIAPYYTQGKDIAWAYLKRYARPLLSAEPHESELRVDLRNGARVRIYGADNPDRLRGIYLDGCVLDEFPDMIPSVWTEVIRPALSDRIGWAVFIGTVKGIGNLWKLYQDAPGKGWYRLLLKASQTGIIPATELSAAKSEMSDDEYEQEYECSPYAAIAGSYYGREFADYIDRWDRICDLPHDPDIPVHTAWDIGVSDYTAIWAWQENGPDVHVINFHQNYGKGVDYYVDVLNDWGYNYGIDWVPPDAKVREWGNNAKPRIKSMIDLGRNPIVVDNQSLMDGINAARIMLRRTWFDGKACSDGIDALRNYRAMFNGIQRAYALRPLHGWASHAADALRYMALAWRGDKRPPIGTDNGVRPASVTFDDLLATMSRERRGAGRRI